MGFHGRLHFWQVLGGVSVIEYGEDFTFLANEKAHAAGEGAFWDAHAVGIGSLALGIGQQRKVELAFLDEALMACGSVKTYAHHLNTFLAERAYVIAQRDGLPCASRCVVLGVKIEQHCLHVVTFQCVRKAPRFVGLVVALDGWRGGAHLGQTGGGGRNRSQTHHCKNSSHLTHAAAEKTNYIKRLNWFKPFFSSAACSVLALEYNFPESIQQ